MVLHPVLSYLIEPTLSGCALSPHRHRDRALISLHLCMQPTHVGTELKNRTSVPDGSGAVIRGTAMGGKLIGSTLMRGAAIRDVVIGMRMVSALAIGAIRTWDSVENYLCSKYHSPSSSKSFTSM
jgi:hypothetical protein